MTSWGFPLVSGPKLHRHPYAEVFITLEGETTFTIVPAYTLHKFVNTGLGPLRQIDIHTNDRFVTEWLEE